MSSVDCEECGSDLHIDLVDRPNVDWVKLVCSDCGHVNLVSMVRLSASNQRTVQSDSAGAMVSTSSMMLSTLSSHRFSAVFIKPSR